ncbi:MAG TPA: SDR family oxidoreductase [Phycisphaerales bacterium]|nr:SDR family oxidoreductase [Phycisphaerales bacterium]
MHIVVNGANRGIGLEFCRQARQRGHRVTALCRNSSEELETLQVDVVEGVEVTSPPPLEQVREIDWLILNAGIWADESLENFNFETLKEQFEVNSLGPMRMFFALCHGLHRGSKIGIISSLMGSVAENSSGGRYGYRASKAALNCMGVSLAHDLKSEGIPVALFHPGYVATDMTSFKGTISPKESVEGLFSLMEKLELESSGTFWNYRGEVVPW